MSSSKRGQLSIAVGCMFAGKTSWLLDKYEAQKIRGKNCYPINYSADTRYHNEKLSTHDERMIDCFRCEYLYTLLTEQVIRDYDVFLINEAQFFGDLVCAVKILLDNHKKVYICGLDGDFRQEKFGNILDLVPLCDKIIKLRARCVNCKEPAIFTKRLSKQKEQKVIGSDNYIAVCRQCII